MQGKIVAVGAALMLIISGLFTSPAFTQSQTGSAEPAFTAAGVKAHVAALADDAMDGRNAGTPGFDRAADYVAGQFQAMGLTPMGANKGWFQPVTLRQASPTDEVKVTLTQRDGSVITSADGVAIAPNVSQAKVNVSAPIVFVGYGIDRPDRGMESYKGVNVKGKIVAYLRDLPKNLTPEERTYIYLERDAMAARKGAVGVLKIPAKEDQSHYAWFQISSMVESPVWTWMQTNGAAFTDTPGLKASMAVNAQVAKALFAASGRKLEDIWAASAKKGAPLESFDMGVKAAAQFGSSFKMVSSANVVGMLPGSDPKLADEYVVITAHLDHLGHSENAKSKDNIFNGALDNAIGVATMLEAARALANAPVKPRRPIMFVALTGEEKGLLGSERFAHFPAYKGKGAHIVAAINMDMPLLLFDFPGIVALGEDKSTMGPVAAQALAPMGLSLMPDPTPEELFYFRSDHYSFVKMGIPALSVDPFIPETGKKAADEFLKKRYHRPNDDMNQPINWDAAAKFAEANYRIVRAVADAPQRPIWYQGDFFGDIFAPKAPKVAKP